MAAVRVIALVACTALCGCPGDVDTGGGGGSDSGTSGADAKIDAPKLMWVDAATGSGSNLPCRNQVLPAPHDGHHFPGQSCFQACHNHGWTVAGTLYTNDTGNTAFVGANITLTDSNNQTINLLTGANGNFYTQQAIAFPVLVIASACPSAVKMTLAVAASGRACNSCHVGGTSMQMHLP
ncbi:MAG TPA: hypothetical protein VIV11_10895 [Kofleriaceae bacterium]